MEALGHLNGPVAIGIGLDHRHNQGTGFALNCPEIIPDGIQINLDIGIIAIQVINSRILKGRVNRKIHIIQFILSHETGFVNSFGKIQNF